MTNDIQNSHKINFDVKMNYCTSVREIQKGKNA